MLRLFLLAPNLPIRVWVSRGLVVPRSSEKTVEKPLTGPGLLSPQAWWTTTWSCTSCAVTGCWRASASAGRASPAGSSMATSNSGRSPAFAALSFGGYLLHPPKALLQLGVGWAPKVSIAFFCWGDEPLHRARAGPAQSNPKIRAQTTQARLGLQTRVSQPLHCGHLGLDNPLSWGLSCVLHDFSSTPGLDPHRLNLRHRPMFPSWDSLP